MATMMFEPRWLREGELKPGLTLRLDPDELERRGGIGGEGPNGRVIGFHWFLCVHLAGRFGLWLPLFSRLLPGRRPLSHAGRTGASWWTAGEWHYELRQVWRVPSAAIVPAAFAGRDPSTPHCRNRLRPSLLPLPWRAVAGGA